ncbi:autotransporter outer membrane beta-barrel domain-containing protein, partial [Bartonella sp. LJL80]
MRYCIKSLPFISSFLLSTTVSFAGITCTVGSDCSFDTTSSNAAIAKGSGSHLILNGADVTLTSAIVGNVAQNARVINAESQSKITFNGNTTWVTDTDYATSTVPWANITGGSAVTIKGNLSLAPVAGASNPFVTTEGTNSLLEVFGDLNAVLKSNANSSGTKFSPTGLYAYQGGLIRVHGATVIDVQDTGTFNFALMTGNGRMEFADLTLTLGGGAKGISSTGVSGSVLSTGMTLITGDAMQTAISVTGDGFVSLGEEPSKTSELETGRSGKAIINIGQKATINSGLGIDIRGNTESLTIVSGKIFSSEAANNTAILSRENIKDTVLLTGNAEVLGDIDLGGGDDTVTIESGRFLGDLFMRDGNDRLVLSGGKIDAGSTISMDAGNDHVELSAGLVLSSISMGTGNDTAVISGSVQFGDALSFDGGSDGTDTNTGELTLRQYANLRAYTKDSGNDSNKGVNLTDWSAINLVDGSTLTMTSENLFDPANLVNTSRLTLDRASVLTNELAAPNAQTVNADVYNAGSLRMDGNEIAGDLWTIRGNYSGDRGTIVFDTQLGDDSSPTDFLQITGNATGTTGVQVVNRGGLGALTTGDGIQLIKVDGTSSADNFALKSDYSFEGQAAVVGGAYAYSLYAGNKAGDFAGDWYLRSLYVKPVEPPQPPVGPVEPPVIEPKPVYSAVVPMYEVYPQILQQLNKLGTLEQRIGNRTWIGTGSD